MFRRPPAPVFVGLLLLLCIGLVVWQRWARRSNRISLPESGAYVALRPAQRLLSVTGNWFSDVGRAMFRRPGLLSENERLQDEVANLKGQNQRLLRYGRENQELRGLLKMPRPGSGKFLAADILSLNFSDAAQRILLNIGSRQGVRPKDVVFSVQGVVGQVENVDLLTSQVILLTDRRSGIGAMMGRSAARGIVQGTGDRICKMSYLNFQADVREGDTVLTSGESTIFPRGLVIGRVLKVEKNKTYSRLIAYISPAVPLDQLSAVYVRVRAN